MPHLHGVSKLAVSLGLLLGTLFPARAEGPIGKSPADFGQWYLSVHAGFSATDGPETDGHDRSPNTSNVFLSPSDSGVFGGTLGYVFGDNPVNSAGWANARVEGAFSAYVGLEEKETTVGGSIRRVLGGGSSGDTARPARSTRKNSIFHGSIGLKGDTTINDAITVASGFDIFIRSSEDNTFSIVEDSNRPSRSAKIDSIFYGAMLVAQPEFKLSGPLSFVSDFGVGAYLVDVDSNFRSLTSGTSQALSASRSKAGFRLKASGGFKYAVANGVSTSLTAGVDYWSQTPYAHLQSAQDRTDTALRFDDLLEFKTGVTVSVALGERVLPAPVEEAMVSSTAGFYSGSPADFGQWYLSVHAGFSATDGPETDGHDRSPNTSNVFLSPSDSGVFGGTLGYVFGDSPVNSAGWANARVEGAFSAYVGLEEKETTVGGSIRPLVGGGSSGDTARPARSTRKNSIFHGSIGLRGDKETSDNITVASGFDIFIRSNEDNTFSIIEDVNRPTRSSKIDSMFYGAMLVVQPEFKLSGPLSFVSDFGVGAYLVDVDSNFRSLTSGTSQALSASRSKAGFRLKASGGFKYAVANGVSTSLTAGVDYWSQTPYAHLQSAQDRTDTALRFDDLLEFKTGVTVSVALGNTTN